VTAADAHDPAVLAAPVPPGPTLADAPAFGSAPFGGANPFAMAAAPVTVPSGPLAVEDLSRTPLDVPTAGPGATASTSGRPRSVLGPDVGAPAAAPRLGHGLRRGEAGTAVPPAASWPGSALGGAAADLATRSAPAAPQTEAVPTPRSGQEPTGRRLPEGQVPSTAAAQSGPEAGSRPGAAFAAVGTALVPGQPTASSTSASPFRAPAGLTTASATTASSTSVLGTTGPGKTALGTGLGTAPSTTAPSPGERSASGRDLPPGGVLSRPEPAARPSRRRLVLVGAAAAAVALGAVVVVSGLPGEAPVLEPSSAPAASSSVVDPSTTAADDATTSAAADATAPAEATADDPTATADDVAAAAAALVDEPVERDPFSGTTTGTVDTTVPEAVASDATVPSTTTAPDLAGTGASTVVPAGLQVTWTEVRDGGWYVFTLVDGTEGTTVAATAGSALGLEAPESDVVFTGPSTVVDGTGVVVDSVSVRTSTSVLQLVLGQAVTVS